MELQGKKFLVIGGAGFIGSHIVDELLQEGVAEIRVFDNFSRGKRSNLELALRDPRVKIIGPPADIQQPQLLADAMSDIDGVFHLAALWLLHCQEFQREALKVNIEGTFNVVEAVLKSKVARLVFSSSASVYGEPLKEPMDEDHPFRNENFYGATKIAGEQICRSLYHRYKADRPEFSFVGLRYMNVYGDRQDYEGAYVAVIMKMLDQIDRGSAPVVYGDGQQAYDFINVVDCARANILAMKATTTDQFYNIGSGIKTSIADLAQMILDLSGSKLKVQYEPSGPTFVKNRLGSTEKSRQDLGFSASVDLRLGLQRLIEWRRRSKMKH